MRSRLTLSTAMFALFALSSACRTSSGNSGRIKDTEEPVETESADGVEPDVAASVGSPCATAKGHFNLACKKVSGDTEFDPNGETFKLEIRDDALVATFSSGAQGLTFLPFKQTPAANRGLCRFAANGSGVNSTLELELTKTVYGGKAGTVFMATGAGDRIAEATYHCTVAAVGGEGAACGSGGIAGGHLPPCGANLACVTQGTSPNAGGVCTRTGGEGAACGSGGIAGGHLPPCGANLTCVTQGTSPNAGGVCTRTN